jgi:hypothetical protein
MNVLDRLGNMAFGILPGLANEGQLAKLTKSGALGAAPSVIGKDMAEQDRKEEEAKAIKEIEMAKRQQTGQGMKKGGKVSSASSRADGCATKGKTKGRFV